MSIIFDGMGFENILSDLGYITIIGIGVDALGRTQDVKGTW